MSVMFDMQFGAFQGSAADATVLLLLIVLTALVLWIVYRITRRR